MNILEAMRTVVKEEIRPFRDEFNIKLTGFRSEILTHVDAVYKEVKTMREEQAVMIHTLTDHEHRIDRLETRVGV